MQFPPSRIVSLVPSLTETLFDFGLNDEVVGLTKFCVHPAHWKKEKTIVGGTKNPHIDRIRDLRPDWVLATKEENRKEDIEAIAQFAPVSVFDIQTINDALNVMEEIGQITQRVEVAKRFTHQISNRLEKQTRRPLTKAAYVIWQNPIMVAGGDTFIHHMMEMAGFANLFGGENRYPETDFETLRALKAEAILLSSEPFPFAEKHLPQWQNEIPGSAIQLVDGEMYSWYGTRILRALEYFAIKD